jgi:catechol 2,3-dioxygenase-like lactoylglutathione lyase family enzyme
MQNSQVTGGKILQPRLNIVTLGVKNIERAIQFYRDGLGWQLSSISGGDFAIFKISTGTALALYPRHLLAKDACVEDYGGYGGITLAQNVSSKEEVDRALSQAVLAGGTLLKAAGNTEWGGYSGYFADPDGHPWEVAWAPIFELLQGKVLPD